MSSPPGFVSGPATAAYQAEGAVRDDGRGESISGRLCAPQRAEGTEWRASA